MNTRKKKSWKKTVAMTMAFAMIFSQMPAEGINGLFGNAISGAEKIIGKVKAQEVLNPVKISVDTSKAQLDFERQDTDASKSQIMKDVVVKAHEEGNTDTSEVLPQDKYSIEVFDAKTLENGELAETPIKVEDALKTVGKRIIKVTYQKTVVPEDTQKTTESATTENVSEDKNQNTATENTTQNNTATESTTQKDASNDSSEEKVDETKKLTTYFSINVVPSKTVNLKKVSASKNTLSIQWDAVKSNANDFIKKYYIYFYDESAKKYDEEKYLLADFTNSTDAGQISGTTVTANLEKCKYKDGSEFKVEAGKKYKIKVVAAVTVNQEAKVKDGEIVLDIITKKPVVSDNEYKGRLDLAQEFLTASQPFLDKSSFKVTVSDQTTNSIKLSWPAVSGADGYYIESYNYSKKADGKYVGYQHLATVSSNGSSNYSYVDTGLNDGTTHRYRIYTYVLTEDNRSAEYRNTIKTGTAPDAVTIKGKNGDLRVKLDWSKVTKADGYNIYMKPSGGNYQLVENHKVTGTSEDTTKTVTGLNPGTTYSFKVVPYATFADTNDGDHGSYSNDIENPKATEISYVAKKVTTNQDAKKYSTKKKFIKSAAYKKYAIMKKLKYSKSYILPGLKSTNVAGFESNNMISQSITFAGSYMLVSAYDGNETEKSVIYVLNKATKKYVTTIVLPNRSHVGGIAYDGKNVWVSDVTRADNTSWISCIKYAQISAAARSNAEYVEITGYTTTQRVVGKPSYMTYYKNRVWVGENNERVTKSLYGYEISNKTGAPSIAKKNRIALTTRVQGVCFTSDGKLLISRSNLPNSNYSYYISQIRAYAPKWKNSGTMKKGKVLKVTTMPPMTEGIVTKGTYTYLGFESASFSNCYYPVDRVCAFKTTNFTKKAKKK